VVPKLTDSVVREINKINDRELELGVKGSWHDEYKGLCPLHLYVDSTDGLDSAYVFVGGLAYDLTEGDVVTIMSQYVYIPRTD
jgi:RNA-binding motif X-linked protein 2